MSSDDLTADMEDEPGARPSTAPFGDGRDGAPLGRTAAWWFTSAAVMLILPRQWWAAAAAGTIAACLWFSWWWRQRKLGVSAENSTTK